MATIKRIDHIAIVVEDIETTLGFWRDALGLELAHIEDVPEQKSLVAFLPVGESEIELVRPTTDDSGVAKYLQKRGPGMHHICLEVDDIEGMLSPAQSQRRAPDQRDARAGGRRQADRLHPSGEHQRRAGGAVSAG